MAKKPTTPKQPSLFPEVPSTKAVAEKPVPKEPRTELQIFAAKVQPHLARYRDILKLSGNPVERDIRLLVDNCERIAFGRPTISSE